MGRQLSEIRTEPRPVAIPLPGGDVVTGIEWRTDDAAILFLHDTDDELALDSWGAWPDRFAALGYRVLVVDLPSGQEAAAIAAAIGYLDVGTTQKRFIISAGNIVQFLDGESADACVLVAPRPGDRDPLELGSVPKLIIGGSGSPDDYSKVESYARACRGWSLLSTFVTDNTAEALLEGRHARQIESQIAGFLQDYRAPATPEASRTGRRMPR